MRLGIKIGLLILLILASNILQAQNLDEFDIVAQTKIQGLKIKVYFKDPLKQLALKYPDLDKKENNTKHELLSEYLHNNPLYVFETSRNNKIEKTYWLVGNPRKIRTKNYFKVEIKKPDGTIDKVVDKVNIGGSFFEHMIFFQSSEGRKLIGKGIQIWGNFTMVQPFEPIKDAMTQLIKLDLSNSIPEEILAVDEVKIEPLFDYQKCGLKSIEKRILKITVFHYDSTGTLKNKYPRTEIDTELYLSSTSKDLIGVTTFPFFSAEDTVNQIDNIVRIKSKLENINHYLKDVKITNDISTGQPQRIEGKLIIHGYSAEGHSTNDELYIAEFSKIEGCNFPTLIKFCSLSDVDYLRPRLTIEIDYEMK